MSLRQHDGIIYYWRGIQTVVVQPAWKRSTFDVVLFWRTNCVIWSSRRLK
ncbi:hypothetical protein SAMN02746095_00047 [Acidocella aminolytica 101 = DSM 11237]|nr:hypothetical protein SAMN02746095_00047 [Acidocella aminolytica 101 = DSM 11237]